MKKRRTYHSSCVLKNRLYAFGGLSDDNKSTPTIESIELTKRDEWILVDAPIFDRRIQAVLCPTFSNQVAVFGGKGNKTMAIYDLESNKVIKRFYKFRQDICSNGPACYIGDGKILAQVLEDYKSGLNLYSIDTGKLIEKVL